MPQNTKPGEKQIDNVFSPYRFLENHAGFTYQIRSLLESGFRVKKEAIKKELNPNGWTLDFACGKGFMIMSIPGGKYVGIDTSMKTLREAVNLYGNHYLNMNGVGLAFKNETFDSCIAMDVFHHIKDRDIPPILFEIKRILKRDGRILITDPLKARFFQDPLNACMQTLDRGNYFRNPEELKTLLSQVFNIEKFYIAQSSFIKWQVYILTK